MKSASILKEKKTFKNSVLTSVAITLVSIQSSFATKDIKVGISGRQHPYNFTENNKIYGLEIDLWSEIGRRNNYNIEYVISEFPKLFILLDKKSIDTISNQIIKTTILEQKYLFSTTYSLYEFNKQSTSLPFNRDEKGKFLQANINKTLIEMKSDGTLMKISKKWLNDISEE